MPLHFIKNKWSPSPQPMEQSHRLARRPLSERSFNLSMLALSHCLLDTHLLSWESSRCTHLKTLLSTFSIHHCLSPSMPLRASIPWRQVASESNVELGAQDKAFFMRPSMTMLTTSSTRRPWSPSVTDITPESCAKTNSS